MVEKIVETIDSIQDVKEHYIADGKLVIVFTHELMLYSLYRIKYHMEQFVECQEFIEHTPHLKDEKSYESIYFNLKK
jgi:hypothetical protein